jgi:hypothetical protein
MNILLRDISVVTKVRRPYRPNTCIEPTVPPLHKIREEHPGEYVAILIATLGELVVSRTRLNQQSFGVGSFKDRDHPGEMIVYVEGAEFIKM